MVWLPDRRRVMRNLVLVLCLLLAAATVRAENVERVIGLVKVAGGDAAILRGKHRLEARPGNPLFQGDVLSTGAGGRLGVILRDDTTLSLGPSSEIRLERFDYSPAEQKLGMVLKFARGVMAYLSGKVAKLAPGAVRLETPVATLGVRGTYLAVRVEP